MGLGKRNRPSWTARSIAEAVALTEILARRIDFSVERANATIEGVCDESQCTAASEGRQRARLQDAAVGAVFGHVRGLIEEPEPFPFVEQ